MKRVIFFIIFIVGITSVLSAQYKVNPNKPYSTLKSDPGFITINELTGGIGLAGTTAPFSQYFMGFTSVNGYQVNKNFILGAGTGFYVYESGLLVPLFLDLRFAFYVGKLTPYLFGDGGLLLDVSDFNSTKLFINPGAGVRYALNRNVAINLGAGFLSQVDGTVRETFVNLKVGVVYAF
jgi:opacity protein-like surface antigen